MEEKQEGQPNYNNIQDITKNIDDKKKLSNKQENQINNTIFKNIIIAISISIFFLLLILGVQNIETNIYVTDLKVFTTGLAISTIILFEMSYRKNSGKLCINGIECFFLTLVVMISIYNCRLYYDQYIKMLALAEFLFSIYYVGKSIVLYLKMKKIYANTHNDISEIIKK